MNRAPGILKATITFILVALLAATLSWPDVANSAPPLRQIETSSAKIELVDGRLTLLDKSTGAYWCRDVKSLGSVIVGGKNSALALDTCETGV